MLYNIFKKISKFSTYIYFILFSIINLTLTFYWDPDKGLNGIHNDFNIQTILGIIIMVYCINKLVISKLETKTLLSLMLISLSFIGLYWIFSNIYITVNNSDASNVYDTALAILNNDYGYIGYKSYINLYPHNLTLMTYYIIIIKIFNNYSLIILRLINLIFVIIAYYKIYKITDLIFKDDNTNRIVITLLMTLTQLIFMCFSVYTYCLSYSLIIISCYYFILFQKWQLE